MYSIYLYLMIFLGISINRKWQMEMIQPIDEYIKKYIGFDHVG